MVREKLRSTGRTWWEHALANGPELIWLAVTFLLTTYFLIAAYTPWAYHYVEKINIVVLTVICVYMFFGGILWVMGFVKEKMTSASEGLAVDIAGSLLLATGWLALLFGVMAVDGGDWTARSLAIALSLVWVNRALAAQRIQSGAERIQKVIDLTGYGKQEASHGLGN